MRVLVCGGSGLIGSTVLQVLSEQEGWEVFGTLRSDNARPFFPARLSKSLLSGVELTDTDTLIELFQRVKPNVVVNCAGLTKHLPGADNPLKALPINTMLPHRLANLCDLSGARLIHVSTDCIFSGEKGNYSESDHADAADLYGKSKAMGEVRCPHAVILRTSTIGHELQTNHGLLAWFLSQQGQCKGFRRAIFSGVPTVVFARVVRDHVIPRPELTGIFNIAAAPIAKYDLLKLIAGQYGKSVDILPDDEFVIDRSLSPERFKQATGYTAPAWPELIKIMHSYHMQQRR